MKKIRDNSKAEFLKRVAKSHECFICGNRIGKGEPAYKSPSLRTPGKYYYEHYPCCGRDRFEKQDAWKEKQKKNK